MLLSRGGGGGNPTQIGLATEKSAASVLCLHGAPVFYRYRQAEENRELRLSAYSGRGKRSQLTCPPLLSRGDMPSLFYQDDGKGGGGIHRPARRKRFSQCRKKRVRLLSLWSKKKAANSSGGGFHSSDPSLRAHEESSGMIYRLLYHWVGPGVTAYYIKGKGGGVKWRDGRAFAASYTQRFGGRGGGEFRVNSSGTERERDGVVLPEEKANPWRRAGSFFKEGRPPGGVPKFHAQPP